MQAETDNHDDDYSGWIGWDWFVPGDKLRLDGSFTVGQLEEIAALMRQGGPREE